MTLYQVILFVHAVSVLMLAASLSCEAWMLFQLRRAVSMSAVKEWINPVRSLSVITTVSLVIVELTGAYLTDRLNSWQFAWPKLAFWGVVLVGLLGGLSGKRLRMIRGSCIEGKIDQTVLLRSHFLKLSLNIRVWLVLGILLLTVVKAGVVGSASIVLASLVIGLISAAFPFGKTTEGTSVSRP